MFTKIVLASVFSTMVVTQAAAAPNPAEACATGLKPESRMIFDDVAPLLPTTQPLPALLREHTIALVMGGKLDRAIARESAMAALTCLKILQP
jgi:hypothetical protein